MTMAASIGPFTFVEVAMAKHGFCWRGMEMTTYEIENVREKTRPRKEKRCSQKDIAHGIYKMKKGRKG
jgi:hypothetical protein